MRTNTRRHNNRAPAHQNKAFTLFYIGNPRLGHDWAWKTTQRKANQSKAKQHKAKQRTQLYIYANIAKPIETTLHKAQVNNSTHHKATSPKNITTQTKLRKDKQSTATLTKATGPNKQITLFILRTNQKQRTRQ